MSGGSTGGTAHFLVLGGRWLGRRGRHCLLQLGKTREGMVL